MQQLYGIMQDKPFSCWKKKKRKKEKHTCGATSQLSRRPYRSGQQMRVWHYWVLGGLPYLISGPFSHLVADGCNRCHFMDEWQRSWCRNASSHTCRAQRLDFTIIRVTHLSPGSRPWFYEAMRYQWSKHFPQGWGARRSFLGKRAKSAAELSSPTRAAYFKVVTYRLYLKLWIIASCESFGLFW